jgi:peroxiredoxin
MDPALTVSATYGVPFQMRVHVELSNRPATFIIDKGGVIRFAQRGTTFSDRPPIKKMISELKKLQ